MPEAKPDATSESGSYLETRSASSFKMRAIVWMWKNRFALGKLGVIGGLPDQGKGLICADIIACVTTGRAFPCNEGTPPRGSVIWLTAEDDYDDTVIPRLKAAGADMDRVHIAMMMREGDKRRSFNLATDMEALRDKIDEIGDVVMIVIDPISAYVGVGKINTSSTTDVRGFLMPLTDLASEKRLSVVGIMHFNKKTDVTNAMLRIADSLAYVATARHVYVVVDDAENEENHLFVKAKNNLAPDMKALRYGITAICVGIDDETGSEIYAPYLAWGNEHVKVTATEAMQACGKRRQKIRVSGGERVPAK